MFYKLYFFSLKFVGIVFISLLYSSITSSHIITEPSKILAKYFRFSQIHVLGFQTYSFLHVLCFLHSHRHLLLFHHWFDLYYLSSNLHLHLHEICFVNVFNSFILVIMLKMLRFKASVLFGIPTLLDKSLIVLQLLMHPSNLIAND